MKYLYLILLIFLLSCEEKEVNLFNKKIPIVKNVFLGEDRLMDPWDIILIDSILIISNDRGEPIIEAYDLRGTLIQKFLTHGRGPNEVLTVGSLQKNNKNLYIYGLFQKKFLKYNYNDLLNSNVIKPDSTYSFSFVSNDTIGVINKLLVHTDFLVAEVRDPEKRVAVFDFNNNMLKYGGGYPEKTDRNLSDFENAGLYASSIELSKDGTKAAFATGLGDMIDIYDLSSSTVKSMWSHKRNLPQGYKIIQMGEVCRAMMTDETLYGYTDVTSSDKYIYSIYSGRKFSEKNYSYGNIIRVISWDGKENFELLSDIDINRLTVSSDDKFIFAIGKDENDDPVVVKFELTI